MWNVYICLRGLVYFSFLDGISKILNFKVSNTKVRYEYRILVPNTRVCTEYQMLNLKILVPNTEF